MLKNNDRGNFLFPLQPPREVQSVTCSGFSVSHTAEDASENTELHRKKSPCRPLPYISLKAEIPLRASSHFFAAWKQLRGATSEGQDKCKWKDAGYSSERIDEQLQLMVLFLSDSERFS